MCHCQMLWWSPVNYLQDSVVYRCSDTETLFACSCWAGNTNESRLTGRFYISRKPQSVCWYACVCVRVCVYMNLSQSLRGHRVRGEQTPLWKCLKSGQQWRIFMLVSQQMSAPFVFCSQRDDLCVCARAIPPHACPWETVLPQAGLG